MEFVIHEVSQFLDFPKFSYKIIYLCDIAKPRHGNPSIRFLAEQPVRTVKNQEKPFDREIIIVPDKMQKRGRQVLYSQQKILGCM